MRTSPLPRSGDVLVFYLGLIAIFTVGYLCWRIVGAVRWRRAQSPRAMQRTARSRIATIESGRLPASAKTPEAPSTKSAATFLAAGAPATVQGFRIEKGLIYVGRSLPRPGSEHQDDRCLINPSLPISKTAEDLDGQSMPYWPSYAEINPTARRSYLKWQADGRHDPNIGIGYVFLHFYGLERRALFDKSTEDIPAIVGDLRALLSVYGSNASFQRHASDLLDALRLNTRSFPALPQPAVDLAQSCDIPLPVKVGLGRLLASGSPVGAKEALVWALATSGGLRTPAIRCFRELCQLWQLRFDIAWPNGLQIAAPKRKLQLRYQSAADTFTADVTGEDLPDIDALTDLPKRLQDLLSRCTDALDPFSRLLGRDPGAKVKIDAALLLPRDYVEAHPPPALTALAEKLRIYFETSKLAQLTYTDLCELTETIDPDGRPDAAPLSRIGTVLDRVNIAFEPDRRYGSLVVTSKPVFVLFHSPSGAPVESDGPAYSLARLLVEVGTTVANADGQVVAEEVDAIKSELLTIDGLGPLERARLMAYALSLVKSASGDDQIIRKLKNFGEGERQAIAQAAVKAVQADGRIAPEEVKLLERLYKAIGLPKEQAYSDLNRAGVRDNDVVSAVPQQPSRPGADIPPRPRAGIAINLERLERIKRETAAVSSVLAEIFADDQVTDIIPTAPSPKPSRFEGLDSPHAELVQFLVGRAQIGRSDFDAEAKRLRLLPDGAIETINDWTLDRFSALLLSVGETEIDIDACRRDIGQLEQLQ